MKNSTAETSSQISVQPSIATPEDLPSSPYRIHPSENPWLILVSPPLTASNHHLWSRSMRLALLSTNKLLFIDEGTPTPLRSDAVFPVWGYNNLVLSWILNSLSPTIAQFVLGLIWQNMFGE